MIDKRILPLTIGGLAIGTTEFAVMGLLPDIAESLHVSIPQGGHLISAYALGVVIGAPLLVGYSTRFAPKKVLVGLMILFTLFNGLSAIAPDYITMLLARFFSGLPHGAFFGVGTVVASRLAPKGKQAQFIAYMFTGLTVANMTMIPLVTYLGHIVNWRLAFGIVAFLGLMTLMFIRFLLPEMEADSKRNFKEELAFLKTPKVWSILLITSIGFGGLFAWFSYITPLMTDVTGLDKGNMTYIMILAGSGMVAGNILGGRLADRFGSASTTAVLLLSMVVALLFVFYLSSYKPLSLVLTFLCGALSMSVASPINMMMMSAAPKSEMMSAAFMQAAFNVANTLGAFLGGLPLEYNLPYNYPSLVGVGMTLTGFGICVYYILKNTKGKFGYLSSGK